MNRLARCFCLLIALSSISGAEDLLQLGLKSALNTLTPVPEDAARAARVTAAGMLERYVKQQSQNHLCQYSPVMAESWVELNGLNLSRVTYETVSEADRANGIQQKFSVIVDCGSHRTRKTGASSWSPWVNGLPLFMPAAIAIEQAANGQWTAAESTLKYFNRIGSGRPAINPLLGAGGLPAGVSRTIVRATASTPPAPVPLAAPPTFTITPIPSPAHAPRSRASARGPLPSRPTTARQDRRDVQSSATAPSPPAISFANLIPYFIAAIVAMSVLSPLVKKSKRSSPARRKPNQADRKSPPPLPSRSGGILPPPWPVVFPAPARNPLDLIQRTDNLLTPAELAFFAVLKPLIHSSYHLSSKVRLADLFNAAQGPGWQTAFNKIVGKHIDFVVTDSATSRILCGIELDDSSHARPDRIQRDDFVNEVFARNQLPLLRVPFSWTYYPAGLRAELEKAGLAVAEA